MILESLKPSVRFWSDAENINNDVFCGFRQKLLFSNEISFHSDVINFL